MEYLEIYKNRCEQLFEKKQAQKAKILQEYLYTHIVGTKIQNIEITENVLKEAISKAKGCEHLTIIYIAKTISKSKYAYFIKTSLDDLLIPIKEQLLQIEKNYEKERLKMENKFLENVNHLLF